MQSQRSKLEQEQCAIQQMSPEEAYQNRLRRHKHDALRRTVMSIVAVAAIATVGVPAIQQLLNNFFITIKALGLIERTFVVP